MACYGSTQLTIATISPPGSICCALSASRSRYTISRSAYSIAQYGMSRCGRFPIGRTITSLVRHMRGAVAMCRLLFNWTAAHKPRHQGDHGIGSRRRVRTRPSHGMRRIATTELRKRGSLACLEHEPAGPGSCLLGPLAPSRTLLKFAGEIAGFGGAPALDVACGFGRNAILVAAHGRDVVCVDRDVARLRMLQKVHAPVLSTDAVSGRPGSIMPICIAVNSSSWPFRAASFGSVICVHFVDLNLFGNFATCLITGGYLYIETFGGQSRLRESHPRPLSERCVNLSVHTAPIRQTSRSCPAACARAGGWQRCSEACGP